MMTPSPAPKAPDVQNPSGLLNARGTGRTHAMVMALPDDGEAVTVFVSNGVMKEIVGGMIERLRGSELRDGVNVVVLADRFDFERLRGRRLRADHAFFDHAVDLSLVTMVQPILR